MEDSQLRLVRSLVLAIVVVSMLVTSMKIVSLGFLPADDALRHVAKVVSGKSWEEVVVMRPGVRTDRHEGWHLFLTAVYRLTGCSKEGLLVFSIVFLALLFMLAPVPWLSRPEVWPGTLALVIVIVPITAGRLFYGRPYLFPMAVLLVLCFLWPRLQSVRPPIWAVLVVVLLTSVSTWFHGLPHLYVVPVLAFVLARRWLAAAWLAGAIGLGIFLGAALTGHPFLFIWEGWVHSYRALSGSPLQRMLAAEFQAFPGDESLVLLVLLVLLWRRVRGEWDLEKLLEDPVFVLLCLGWVLGFVAKRFWMDWGFVAALAWLVKELDGIARRHLGDRSHRRIMIALTAGVFLYVSTTNDLGGRWTNSVAKQVLSLDDPAQRELLPDPGGVVYSDSNTVFFDLFYANPNGSWRYMLTYEPTLMPEEDLRIWRNIQWNSGADPAFDPWVAKMKPADRMILRRSGRPFIPGLEWANPVLNTWVGRLPRSRQMSRTPAASGFPIRN